MIKPSATLSRQLFDSYQQVRKTSLSFSHFTNMLNLYPSMLVCMSDGVLDDEEWQGFLNIARDLSFYAENGSEEETLKDTYIEEFKYLLENTELWQDRFLEALKEYIIQSDADKEFILESMYLFANSANGISDIEMKKIRVLSEELSLTS